MSAEGLRGSATGKIYLDMPVTYLKGVGPARAEMLRRLGIVTARDLLFHIPHRYEDASTIKPIGPANSSNQAMPSGLGTTSDA